MEKMGSFGLRKKLEDELMDVGKRLLSLHLPLPLPSSESDDVDLLILLEEAETILVRVPQELVRPNYDSLIPLMTALITDKLFRHANVNIQVAVASCLNEITRLTAPTFPYFDDQMKEIFELFMVALKQLSSESGGRNYERAQQILETLAAVRSCVMMLDININSMIAEMFRFFFRTIRSNHSSDIFNHMGNIMSTIIEESDEVSLELLKALLDSVRVDNKKISPISWELGKTVFEKCSTKLQPFLRKAVKHLNLKADDYDEIIASLCTITSNGKNMVAKTGLSGDGISKMNRVSGTEPERLDNKNHSEKSADILQLNNNQADSDIDISNCAIVQSEKDRGVQQSKRAKKSNHLNKPEEGYARTWKRRGLVNNKEKDLVLALEVGYVDMPSVSAQGKTVCDNKVTSGKRGRPKKQKSTIRLEKGDNRGDHNKMVESPMYNVAPMKEETTKRSSVEYGEEMINSRIMVWWPLDKVFYAGTIEAFDPSTKKHKVKYDDNEEEVLNLREERWKLFDEQPRHVKSSPKQEAGLLFHAREPVKSLEKIVKRKTGYSKEQHDVPSSKRSKSEDIKFEDPVPSVILAKEEVEVMYEAKSSLEAGKSSEGSREEL